MTIDYGLAHAGQLLFDGVPVDITTAANEDLVIAPGTGGNTQIGDATGTNTNATSNDDLHITGILETDGAAYLNSATTLGDSTSDTITLTGYLGSHLIPATDSTYDLGSSTLAWRYIYADIITGYNAALALNPASGYSLTGSVTKNAATGNEVAYDLAATINKATSGNYTGLQLNVTQTSVPAGTTNYLLNLQTGGTREFSVDPAGNVWANGTISGGAWDLTGTTSTTFTIDQNTPGLGNPATLTLKGAAAGYGKIATTNGKLLLDSALGTIDIDDTILDLSTQNVAVTLYDTAVNDGINFDSNTFVIDANQNFVGIGTATPKAELDVNGNILLLYGKSIGVVNTFGNADYNHSIFFDQGSNKLTFKEYGTFEWYNSNKAVTLMTLNDGGTLGFDGTLAREVSMGRHATANTAGNNFTVKSGGATLLATDKNAGSLILSSGTATGSGYGTVVVQAVKAGQTPGTTDTTPTTMATFGNTACLLLPGSATAANSAPLKFTAGTKLTTEEDGAMEYASSHLYFTVGSTRYQLDQQSASPGGLDTQVQYNDGGSAFGGDSGFTYNDATDSVTLAGNLTLPATTSTPVGIIYAGAGNAFIHNLGTGNTFTGVGAGNLSLSGADYNAGFGTSALAALTSGDNNTAVGYGAGDANTSASNNTFMGYNAGTANTSGGWNTFLGVSAGAASTSGHDNTFIGYNAGVASTTSESNIFIGNYAGDATTTANDNIFIGMSAGTTNITGASNTFIGRSAGAVNTASDNTFMGYSAGTANTSGTYNTFIGNYAGAANTTASSNTFIGYYAGKSNTATQNTFVGKEAGQANTSGGDNTFIGYKAGQANVTGWNNTFVGKDAGNANTGGDNTFIGKEAGTKNTSASSNTFVGYYAGTTNVTGTRNTFIGTQAGKVNTASDSTFLGYYAGYANTSGASNTFLGSYAGDATTTGASNIAVGYKAGEALTTGSSNIIIGYDIDAPSATGNNQLTIGNLIFGTGVDGTGTTVSSGNIGIGTATPSGKLHLAGNVSAASWTTSGIQYQGAAATYTDTGTAGTRATGVVSSFAQPTLAGTNAVTITDAATLYIANAPAAGANMTLTNPYALWVDDGAVQIDGNLTVDGTITGTFAPSGDIDMGTKIITNIGNIGTDFIATTGALNLAGDLTMASAAALYFGDNNQVIYLGGDDLVFMEKESNWMRFSTNNSEFHWFSDGTSMSNSIMTLSPSTGLTVLNDDGNTSTVSDILTLNHTTTGIAAAGIGTGLTFDVEDGTGASEEQGSIDVIMDDVTTTAEDSTMTFSIRKDGSAVTEIMRLDGTNNYVGIGTTIPSGKLHLAGNVSAASWLTSGIQYQGAAATYTDTGVAGTRATGVVSSFAQPTLAGTNAVTITDAATVYIANAPAAGANMTLTNPYALWVDDGAVQIDNNLTVGGTITGTVSGGSAITGTTSTTFEIDSDAAAGLILDATGIATSDKTFTFPNVTSKVLTNNMSDAAVAVTLKDVANALNFDSNTLSIDANGNKVGIGIAAPTANLHIDSTAATTMLISNSGGTSTILRFSPSGSGHAYFDQYAAGRNLYFRTSNATSADTTFMTVLSNGYVGLGAATPSGKLHLAGDVSAASWTTSGIQYQGAAATYTDTGTAGTRATGVVSSFAQPTLAGTNAVTITKAATVYIANAPAAGANMTLTNPYALWVDDGAVQIDGNLTVGGTFTGAIDGTTADTFTINSDNHAAVTTTLQLGGGVGASGSIATTVGDLTITPQGDDILLDAGLTVGSTTQAGDNNLRVEGTSTFADKVYNSNWMEFATGMGIYTPTGGTLNIGGGSEANTVVIGGSNNDTISIDSTLWDVSSAGAFSTAANQALAISVTDQGANTNAGVGISISADDGGTGTTGGAGGSVAVTAGDGKGSAANAGGSITLAAGERANAGALGTLNLNNLLSIVVEGDTADANETTLSFAEPTGARTITFPDANVDLGTINTNSHVQNTDTGTTSTTFEIDSDAAAGLILDATGIATSDKTFTFPNVTSKVLTNNMSDADVAVTLSNTNNGLNFDSGTLRIDASSNNVGIGVSAAPGAKLEVGGNLKVVYNGESTFYTTATTGPYLFIAPYDSATITDYIKIGGYYVGGTGVPNLALQTAGGNIGIGAVFNNTIAPSYILSITGASANTIGMERHQTANTAGNNLTVTAGGATLLATDKNAGSLVLTSGTATGDGYGTVVVQAVRASQGTGTTDRSPSTMATFGNTAYLLLPAGAAAAKSAPLKFTSGTSLTTPEAGAMEYDGTNLYFTPAAAQKTIAFTVGSAITGTTSTDFAIGSGTDAAANDITLTFGGTNPETITWDGTGTDNFAFSDLIETDGLTVTANNNLTMSSGTGLYSQTYTGTATDAFQIIADSLTTADVIEVSADALSSGTALNITSTSTAADAYKLINLASSGAAAVLKDRYGIYSSLTGTGTGINFAGYFSATGASTNYAVYAVAPGTGDKATIYSECTGTDGAAGVFKATASGDGSAAKALYISNAGEDDAAVVIETTNTLAAGQSLYVGSSSTQSPDVVSLNLIGAAAGGNVLVITNEEALSYARGMYLRNDGQYADSVSINHTNSSSTAKAIECVNAGTGNGIFINQDGNGTALNIDSEATSVDVVSIDADKITTADAMEITADALTSGSGINIASASTAADAYKLINLSSSGLNATATRSRYGLYSSMIGTGTTSTNYGIYSSASGATTNYPGYFTGGPVMITDGTHSVTYATANGDLFVDGSLEVDGTIYGSVSGSSAITGTTQTTFTVNSGNTADVTTTLALGGAAGTGIGYGAITSAVGDIKISPASTRNVIPGTTRAYRLGSFWDELWLEVWAGKFCAGEGEPDPYHRIEIYPSGNYSYIESHYALDLIIKTTDPNPALAASGAGSIVLDAADNAANIAKTYVSITGSTPIHTVGTPTDIFLDITPTLGVNTAAANTNLIDLTFTSPAWATAVASNLRGLYIAPTIGDASAGTNAVNAIEVANITGDAGVNVTGLKIGTGTTLGSSDAIAVGSGWDNALSVNGTTVIDGSGAIGAVGSAITGTTANTFTINYDIEATASALTLGSASTAGGQITTGAGNLTINSAGGTIDIDDGTIDLSTQAVAVTLNDAANALNFDSDTLSIDALNERVGIGLATPGAKLEVDTDVAENAIGLIVDQNDTTNNNVALQVENAGTGYGMYLSQIGNGTGAYFETNNVNNSNKVISVYTNGTGSAAYFRVDEQTGTPSTVPALEVVTDATGNGGMGMKITHVGAGGSSNHGLEIDLTNTSNDDDGIYVYSNSTGRAGYFRVDESVTQNTSPALYVTTDATGNGGMGMKIEHVGAGGSSNHGLEIDLTNTSNNDDGIYVYSNSTGRAGYFRVDESVTQNTSPALYVLTDATGAGNYGLQVQHVGTGTAAFIDQDGNSTSLSIDSDATSATVIDVDPANTSGDIINLDWAGATTQAGALTALDLDFTNLTSVAGSTTYGVHINDLGTQTSSTEYAIYQEGTNWDYGIWAADICWFNNDVEVNNWLKVHGYINFESDNQVFGRYESGTVNIGNTKKETGGITVNLGRNSDAATGDTFNLNIANCTYNFATLSGTGDITLDPAGNDVFPGSDSTDNLGSTTVRWANVWGDLINGADYSYENNWRTLEAEKYKGYPKGIAIGNEGFSDGTVTEIMPEDIEPVFVVTEDFIEYKGRRITPEILDKLLMLADKMGSD